MATDYLKLADRLQTAARFDDDEAAVSALVEMLAGVGLALDRIAGAAERLADATERKGPVEVTSKAGSPVSGSYGAISPLIAGEI